VLEAEEAVPLSYFRVALPEMQLGL
jgi:hypothetical protein